MFKGFQKFARKNSEIECDSLEFSAEFKDLGLSEDKKFGYFEGYGAVFGNKDSVGDVIVKGAFVESLKTDGNPAMLLQHNSQDVIGVWEEVYEDERGLYLKGCLNLDVQKSREAYSLLKQGALKGLSIGYITKDYAIDHTNGVRTLKALKLLEVSIVTFPANEKAKITRVKMFPKTIREFEKFLRDSGFGKTQSKAIASDGWKGFERLQRDVEPDETLNVRRDADVEAINTLKNLVNHMKGLKNDPQGNQKL